MKSKEQNLKKICVKNTKIKGHCLLIVIITFAFASCAKDEIIIDPDNLLIGNWNYSDYNDDALLFERSNGFVDDHCYKLIPEGSMTERINSGWCGTPPISFEDFPGTWSVINDTLVEVSVGYWGGTDNYILDFKFLGQNLLELKYIRQE